MSSQATLCILVCIGTAVSVLKGDLQVGICYTPISKPLDGTELELNWILTS